MQSKLVFFLLLAIPVVARGASAHALATYLDLPDGAQSVAFATDTAGNFFVAFYGLKPSGRKTFGITKTDPHGLALASMDFDAGIAAVAVDPNGDVVVVGTTSPTGIPLVSPLISKTSQVAAFIMKIDSQLQNILFSTLLGGTEGAGPLHGGTFAGALAIDANGNIYVTGATLDTDFPVTSGAFQTQPPQGDEFGSSSYAFLTEISADGKRIVFSTYFGSEGVYCLGGSHCIGVHAGTGGAAIALDAEGDVVIAGATSAYQLPITPGVFGPTCGDCSSDLFASFLAKFAPDGSKLLWATYVPVSYEGLALGTALHSMILDSSGNIIVGGSTPGGFTVTAGALQTVFPVFAILSGFVSKFDSTAQHLLFSTYFGGGDTQTGVAGLTLDSQGTIWITGFSAAEELPAPNGTPLLGPIYVAGLSREGSTLTNIFTAPDGAAGEAILETREGMTIALGPAHSLLTVSAVPGPSLVGVANSAASFVSPVVSPSELISLYGIGLGGSTPAGAQVVNGVVTDSLNGVKVLFDGVAAPLLYVGETQINAVVPSEVSERDTTTLQIVTPSGIIAGPTLSIRPSQPAVFTAAGTDAAAALNEDGSVNSPANPAQPGSIVTVWATGAHGLSYPEPDGEIAKTAAGAEGTTSVLQQDGLSLEVLYAGDAPGLVIGVVQVNFRLPSTLLPPYDPPRAFFQLQSGDAVSTPFSIYVTR